MNNTQQFGEAERVSLICRAGDLKARMLLLDLAEAEYNRGNKASAAKLLHAMDYLKDRLVYQIDPPPSPSHIRMPFDPATQAGLFGGEEKLSEE